MKVWPLRRLVQVLVILVMIAIPIVARYSHYLAARQIDKMISLQEGTLTGALLKSADTLMRTGLPDGEGGVPTRRPRKAILKRSKQFYGSVWSMKIFGRSLTDPLAGVESIIASKKITYILFLGLLIPLLVTALLGRVYCAWVCPMGLFFDLSDKIRKLIRFLELKPLKLEFWKGNKYIILGLGLLVSAITGLHFLHYIYPPALLGRETHDFVMAMFDRAETVAPGWVFTGFSTIILFLLAILLVEVMVAPRFFCRSICPGGALYSLLGKYRLLRVKRRASACTDCALCNRLCPRGLEPMTDGISMECDNCGVCIDVCDDDALSYSIPNLVVKKDSTSPAARHSLPEKKNSKSRKVSIIVLFLFFIIPTNAQAHHIMGIPHYAYDENYPQAPVLKLVENVGEWSFQLTGYPGNPKPGQPTQLNVYVVKKNNHELYSRPLTLEIYRQNILQSKKLIYGPRSTEREENLFKFYPVYPGEGNYEIILSFDEGEVTSTMRFAMVVGNPGSPLSTLAWFGGGVVLFIVVVRAVKIKRERRLKTLRILEANEPGESSST